MLPKKAESPKFEAAVDYLRNAARQRRKVVVFCKRHATIAEMRRRLKSDLKDETSAERKTWERVRTRAKRQRLPLDFAKLRLATQVLGNVAAGREKRAVARLERKIAQSGWPGEKASLEQNLNAAWGHGRHTDWIGELSGRVASRGRVDRPAVVQFAFNLPGPPYILLCTDVAREGIDLHLWCRDILHYDLEWNPADMEQQVGRVDRVGSLSRRVKKPVLVGYAWTPGTYEEYMAQKVRDRVEIIRDLLGA
jgi:hypothetical protein